MSAPVTDSFTSATTGTATSVTNGVMEVSGTFSGTIQLKIDALGNGVYAPAADSSGAALSITAPCVMRIANGVPCSVRAECTAYTSGTAVVTVRNN